MAKAVQALKSEAKRVAERIEEIGKEVMDGDGGLKLAADEKTVTELKTLGDELAALKGQIETFEGAEGMLASIKGATPPVPGIVTRTDERPKSLSEQILGDRDQYKADMWQRGVMYEASVKTTFTTTSTSDSGLLPEPQRVAPYFPPTRRLTVRDAFFMPGQTSAAAVEYFELTTETNNAAGVAEGGEKPENAYQFTKRTKGIDTVATTLPVTNQMLSDYPAMVSMIEGRMLTGLDFTEEQELVWGNGADTLTGIMNTIGVVDGSAMFAVGANDTYLDIIRKMVTAAWSGTGAMVEGHYPTAVGVSPLIKQEIDLTKDQNLQYVFAVVQDRSGMRVWGLDIIESNAFRDPADLNDHYILVGAKTAGQIWDRETANVAIGLVNDDFKRNKQTIRVEKRLTSGLYCPSSYVYYQLENVS
ncbi:MAG: phage major capsid protein [Actinomycetia bacterium]|nr:phage major capsid protein [Actinomycetes bacterium]